jgi:hypothetical protein
MSSDMIENQRADLIVTISSTAGIVGGEFLRHTSLHARAALRRHHRD